MKCSICGQEGHNRNNKRFHSKNIPMIVKTHPEISVSSVMCFFKKSTRAMNSCFNNQREFILSKLDKISKIFFDDSTYGQYWNNLKNEWNKALTQISTCSYTNIDVILKAGRRNYYDFDILYYNKKDLVNKQKVEFKFGVSSINKLPQILSLSAKNTPLFSESYPEFFYKHYLDEYLNQDENIRTITKPALNEYMKYIGQIDYKKLLFFQILKDTEHINKNNKFEIVNKSIFEYLKKYKNGFDLQQISEKLKSSQTDKIYFMWNDGKFYVNNINIGHVLQNTSTIINKNTLVFRTTANLCVHILLRWRNHKGILNPAYQISIKLI